jgi:hypothetical protein
VFAPYACPPTYITPVTTSRLNLPASGSSENTGRGYFIQVAAEPICRGSVRNCGQEKKFPHSCEGNLYPAAVKTSPNFAIRCGTPDCDWGFHMPDLGELALESCYSSFRRHCVEIDGLSEADSEAQVFLDLEKWTLTILK